MQLDLELDRMSQSDLQKKVDEALKKVLSSSSTKTGVHGFKILKLTGKVLQLFSMF